MAETHRAAERMRGRRIVVTGAGSGIGRRTAELLAAEGAALALFDRTEPGLRAAAEATGGTPYVVDVTSEESVAAAAAQAAQAMGGIDGIVNAAGIHLLGSVEEVDAAAYRRVVDVNLTGPYIVIRCCLKWLYEAPFATIVNIASGQGLLPNAPNGSAYAAAKGGVVNLTRALAAELAPTIRVNSVCPGMVDTPMAAATNVRDYSAYAMKRIGTPTEIAEVILFLMGAESSIVTGAAFAADGGRTYH